MQFNNLYIDSIYIDNNSSVDMTNNDGYENSIYKNYLKDLSVNSAISTIKGTRWIIQLTNGSALSIDFNSNNMILRVRTYYKNSSSDSSYVDYDYHLKNGILLSRSSIYFGWANNTQAPIDDLYIQTLHLDNNNSYTMTSSDGYEDASNGNYLKDLSVDSNTSTTKGSRWLVQITNGSSNQIDFSVRNAKLNLCVNYKSSVDGAKTEKDIFYYLINGLLNPGASIYFGWGKKSSNLTSLFIDSLYIDNNSNTDMTSSDGYTDSTNGNFLSGLTVNSNLSTTKGSRWLIQLTNGSEDSINFTTNNLRLNVLTSYKLSNNNYTTTEKDYYLKNGTLSSEESLFFGWGNSTTKTINNIYIDTIYIDNNSSTDMTSSDGYTDSNNGNFLDGLDVVSDISTTTGSRWVVQVTNGSDSRIDFSDNNLIFNVCSNYKDSGDGSKSSNDKFYYLTSGRLSAGSSMYYGWGSDSTKIINDLYIDTLYIDNNSSTNMSPTDGYNDTTNGNYLFDEDVDTNLSTTHGSRWLVQITNASTSTINFSNNNLRFNICANFKNGEDSDKSSEDTFYYVTNGTLSSGSSMYFGWGNDSATSSGILGLVNGKTNITVASSPIGSGESLDGKLIPGLSNNGSTVKYLLMPDQIVGNNILANCRIRLRYDHDGNGGLSYRETMGISTVDDDHDDTDEVTYFNYSLKRNILFSSGSNNSGASNSISAGSLYRKDTIYAPSNSYSVSDWNYASSTASSSDTILSSTAFSSASAGFGVLGKAANVSEITLSSQPPTSTESLDGKLIPGMNISYGDEKYLLLADQIVSGNILSNTRFRLFYDLEGTSSGSYIETLGDTTVNDDYSSTEILTNFVYSIKRNILYSSGSNATGTNNSVSSGSLSRNTNTTIPNDTFTSTDWDYKDTASYNHDTELSNNIVSTGSYQYGILGLASGASDLTISSNPPTSGESLDGKLIPGLDSSDSNIYYLLLSDQISSGNIIATTIFKIFYDSNGNGSLTNTEILGNNDPDNSYSGSSVLTNFDYSIKKNILYSSGNNNTGTNRLVSIGSLNRNSTATGPNTSYSSSDWSFSSDSGSTILSNNAISQTTSDGVLNNIKNLNDLTLTSNPPTSNEVLDGKLIPGLNSSNGIEKYLLFPDQIYNTNIICTTRIRLLYDHDALDPITYRDTLGNSTYNSSGEILNYFNYSLKKNILYSDGSNSSGTINNVDSGSFSRKITSSAPNVTYNSSNWIYVPTTTNSAQNELFELPPKSGVINKITDSTNISLANNPPNDGDSLNAKLIPGLSSTSTRENYLLLADQIDSNNIISSTVFFLLFNGDIIDTLGSSSVDSSYTSSNLTNFQYSIKKQILYTSGLNNTGLLRNFYYGGWSRNSIISTTAPNTTYDNDHWDERLSSVIVPDQVLNGTAIGDPHITTIFGNHYKFDYIGAFRLFDNNEPEYKNKLIINGLSMRGSKKRWRRKQYIRKLYIQHGDKYILINTGFRGTKAHIIENNGIEYIDEELEFNQNAKIHCFFCGTNFDLDGFENGSVKNHLKRNKRHIVLKPIRNNLTLKFNIDSDLFLIKITNINEFNLQPCRIELFPYSKKIKNLTGCIINRKYVKDSLLNDIKNIDKINYNFCHKDMPKITKSPFKKNIKLV